ncbi:MAG: hypothetical protein ABEI96_10795 [Haloarculaceae archaeon]
MHDKGQTTQDYVIGISLVLLTLTGVFLVVPGIFNPFADPVDSTDRTMADSVATTLIREYQVDGTKRTLEYAALKGTLDDDDAFADVVTAAGVPPRRRVSVVVLTDAGSTIRYDAPNRYDGNSATALTIRVVDFTDDGRCDAACRLVVRVW